PLADGRASGEHDEIVREATSERGTQGRKAIGQTTEEDRHRAVRSDETRDRIRIDIVRLARSDRFPRWHDLVARGKDRDAGLRVIVSAWRTSGRRNTAGRDFVAWAVSRATTA